MPLLVLRPEPGAAATVARAAALGLRAVAAPLFAIAPNAWEPPEADAHDALFLTSANAVRQAGAGLSRLGALPVYAVGAATAEAARAAGLSIAGVGEADAAALLARAAGDGIRRPLHLAGAEHRAVAHPGVELTRMIVYRSVATDTLPDIAISALNAGATSLVHSPRSAGLFAALIDRDGFARGRLALAAISPAAAAAAGEGWGAVSVAAHPHDDALLAAAAALCETEGRS